MVKCCLIVILCTAAFGGTITYGYTGSPFTACTFGTCPANYTSDYIIASISFAAPLAANLPLTEESAALTGWTFGDALGNFSYSSSDPSTAAYLTGIPADGVSALALSTDINGNIVDSDMGVFPAEVLGLVGTSEGGIFNPTGQSNGLTVASFVEINWGTAEEWDAVSSTPGQWTQTPEPSSLLLTTSSVAALVVAIWRKYRSDKACSHRP